MARSGSTSIRRIRVVGHERARWPIVLGLWIPVGVAVVGFVVWRFVGTTRAPDHAYRRRLDEVTLTWQCANGHSFRAKGQSGPVSCPGCGAPANPADVYLCAEHGKMTAELRFDAGSPDPTRPRAVQYRFSNGEWRDMAAGVRCPRCSRDMEPLADDPLNYRKQP